MANSPKDILISYKQKIIDALKDSLVKNDRVARGGLTQSIEVQYRAFATTMTLQVLMSDYYTFVDKGVDGTAKKHGSPYKFKKKNINQKAMLKDIANRGITKYKKKDGTVVFDTALSVQRKKEIKGLKTKGLRKKAKGLSLQKRRNTLAFLLGRGIAKYGIKPTHFIDEAFKGGILDDLTTDISTALGRDILIELDLKDK